MIMKPSFEVDMFVSQSILNTKKIGYFDASAGFRVALPSLRPVITFHVFLRLNNKNNEKIQKYISCAWILAILS